SVSHDRAGRVERPREDRLRVGSDIGRCERRLRVIAVADDQVARLRTQGCRIILRVGRSCDRDEAEPEPAEQHVAPSDTVFHGETNRSNSRLRWLTEAHSPPSIDTMKIVLIAGLLLAQTVAPRQFEV